MKPQNATASARVGGRAAPAADAAPAAAWPQPALQLATTIIDLCHFLYLCFY